MSTFIRELQESCGYDPEADGSVDDLIAYKDALEDIVGVAIERIEARIEHVYFERIEHQLDLSREEWEAMSEESQIDAWESLWASWGWEDECNYDAVEGEIGGLEFALASLREEATHGSPS